MSPPQLVTFAGTFSCGVAVDGLGFLSKFNFSTTSNNNDQPGYLTIDKNGSLYLADTYNNRIRKLNLMKNGFGFSELVKISFI